MNIYSNLHILTSLFLWGGVSRREIHNLMTIGEIAGSFGVCVATVRRWCKNGKFSRVIRTIKNQRRFDPDEVHEMLHPTRGKRIMVGYARVSSYDQRSDLTAQAERLSQYGCQPVIKDLGSGLNCKKPGLKRFQRKWKSRSFPCRLRWLYLQHLQRRTPSFSASCRL